MLTKYYVERLKVLAQFAKYEAVYRRHMLCVCSQFVGREMTKSMVAAVKAECIQCCIRCVRLDAVLDKYHLPIDIGHGSCYNA